MLLPQQRVAERQPGGDSVLPQQRQNLRRVMISEPDASASPEAVRRCAIDRSDVAPVIKIFPVLIKQRQKHTIQFIKLKQPRKVIVCGIFF